MMPSTISQLEETSLWPVANSFLLEIANPSAPTFSSQSHPRPALELGGRRPFTEPFLMVTDQSSSLLCGLQSSLRIFKRH